MKRGRPAAIRSRMLVGTGRGMNDQQWAHIQRELQAFYHKPDSEAPSRDDLDLLFARYTADAEIWKKVVGTKMEQRDLAAIAKDAQAFSQLVPSHVHGEMTHETGLRLWNRLTAFPPIADAHYMAAGVDLFPLLERLRSTILIASVGDRDMLVQDLTELADVCSNPPPQDLRTKPTYTARDRFIKGVLAVLVTNPPTIHDSVEQREALVKTLCVCLRIPEPKRARPKK